MVYRAVVLAMLACRQTGSPWGGSPAAVESAGSDVVEATGDTGDEEVTGPGAFPQAWATDVCPTFAFDLVGSWDSAALSGASVVTDRDPGLGVVDIDADGDEDVLYGWAGGTVLLRNDGNGALSPAAWRVDGEQAPRSRAIAVSDLDGDGDEDLVLGFDAPERDRILWNEGGLGFRSELLPGGTATTWSVSLGDFDANGRTDIYTATYDAPFDYDYITSGSARGSGNGFWLQARGGWVFQAVPASVDVALSLQGVPLDADMDRRLDLYMINDFGPYVLPNQLLRNTGDGRFEVDASCSCQLSTYAMGGSVADVNGDDAPDLISTNIGWMSLLLNDGSGAFYDAGRSRLRYVPAPDRMTSWGAHFTDFDLDGDEDVVVAFGALGPNGSSAIGALAGTDASWSELQQQVTTIFANDGEGNFAPLPVSAFPEVGRARAVVTADLDGDAAPDLVVAGRDRVQAWRNRGGCGRGIVVELVGPRRHRSAIGARVRSRVGGRWRTQWLLPSTTASQATRKVFIGLGDASSAERLEVLWSDGTVTVTSSVTAGRVTLRHEGDDHDDDDHDSDGGHGAAERGAR